MTPAAGSIVVYLSDGRELDVTGKTAEEAVASIRSTIGAATILRTEHRIPSILEGLTLEQLERLTASNRDRGIRVSPQLRDMLERRRREARSVRCSLPACRRPRREGASLCEWHLTGERPRGLRAFRYEGRYILANGSPRSFRVDAHNLADAAAAIERQAREELGAAFAGARCHGTERTK